MEGFYPLVNNTFVILSRLLLALPGYVEKKTVSFPLFYEFNRKIEAA